MASEKTVKFMLGGAIVALVLGVAGYVLVFALDYTGCKKLEDQAIQAGKPMSCSDIRAEAKARRASRPANK